MPENAVDIGIDLGTSTVIIYQKGKGIVLKEPSVVAVDTRSGAVISVGEEAFQMLGRTPDRIRALRPLADGVISDYELCEKMIQFFLKKTCGSGLLKPRVALCVPSGITDVESRAVVEAAASAGARKVYLIEEPVAAAIGAGIDIEKPQGNMVIDIGGGTADIAVLSLSGIVQKTSIKTGGEKFDEAIVRYIRDARGVLIGEKMAEKIKWEIGSVDPDAEDKTAVYKGRNLRTGLPCKGEVGRFELRDCLTELASQIIWSAQAVMEKTPPELVGDILVGGVVMTGGGCKLHGLEKLASLRLKTGARLAEAPEECVAIGTGRSFEYLDKLSDGFITSATYRH
jgi:rod shape-determining protein MreB